MCNIPCEESNISRSDKTYRCEILLCARDYQEQCCAVEKDRY